MTPPPDPGTNGPGEAASELGMPPSSSPPHPAKKAAAPRAAQEGQVLGARRRGPAASSSRQPRVRQPLETGTGHLLAAPDRQSPLTLELSFLGCAHERVPCGGSLRARRWL